MVPMYRNAKDALEQRRAVRCQVETDGYHAFVNGEAVVNVTEAAGWVCLYTSSGQLWVKPELVPQAMRENTQYQGWNAGW